MNATNKVHKYLNNIHTIKWLRKRASENTQIQYLNNASELEQHQAIVRVFNKFDDDGSGTLEVAELRDMFELNNIDITSDELNTLFGIVDEDNSGALDLNEFKEFALSEIANKHFREIITELRFKEIYKQPEKRAKLLPFNFSTLLNFLSDETRKENLRDEIFSKDKKFYSSNVKQDLNKFLQLFKHAYSKVRSFLNKIFICTTS